MPLPALLLAALAAAPASAKDDNAFRELLGGAKAESIEPAPVIQGVAMNPGTLPPAGHNAPKHHPSQYDIWSRNCHTQANAFAAHANANGQRAGILTCQGNPERDPGFHTANWGVEAGGRMCVYNWGESCCWAADGDAPDIASGTGRRCAQWACGAQYDAAQTRVMPPGKLVESPGPQVCAIEAAGGEPTLMPGRAIAAITQRTSTGEETVQVPADDTHPDGMTLNFSPDRLEGCRRCCDDRAAMWSGQDAASVTKNLASGREDQFRRNCQSACRAAFTPPRR